METPQISRVGIVGAGTVGPMIAFRCLLSGIRVHLFDTSPGALAQAVDKIRAWLTEQLDNAAVAEEAPLMLIRASFHTAGWRVEIGLHF